MFFFIHPPIYKFRVKRPTPRNAPTISATLRDFLAVAHSSRRRRTVRTPRARPRVVHRASRPPRVVVASQAKPAPGGGSRPTKSECGRGDGDRDLRNENYNRATARERADNVSVRTNKQNIRLTARRFARVFERK